MARGDQLGRQWRVLQTAGFPIHTAIHFHDSLESLFKKVKIRFAPEVAGYIQEKVWHESQKTHPQKDGSILFDAEVAATDEIKYWIMAWGAKAEVLEPASLREEIRREAAGILARYEPPMAREDTSGYS